MRVWPLRLILIFALLGPLACRSAAQVRKPIGSVTRQVQPAFLLRQASARAPAVRPVALSDNSTVNPGDVLETGPAGRAQITLRDGSVIMLGPQSRLRLPDNDTRPRFQLIRGIARVRFGRNTTYEVLTETALSRTRGGALLVDARTHVATFVLNLGAGTVEVEGERGKATLQAGEGIWTDRGYAAKPRPDELQKLLAEADVPPGSTPP